MNTGDSGGGRVDDDDVKEKFLTNFLESKSIKIVTLSSLKAMLAERFCSQVRWVVLFAQKGNKT